jgi:hypothetical protein
MLPLTWQQNVLSWSLNVEWIIKNPLFYGFLALFLLEAVEVMDVTFKKMKGYKSNVRISGIYSYPHHNLKAVFSWPPRSSKWGKSIRKTL